MKRNLSLLFVLSISLVADAQKIMTSGEIYRSQQGAVVEICLGTQFSGNGFIISADGIIVTANHVVTTLESNHREYAANIVVLVGGKPYSATPVAPIISSDQVNYDYALLKIPASHLPHVTLGNWQKLEIGDPLTIITSFPSIGELMLQGTVSGKAEFPMTDFGPKLLKNVLFQAPIRKGFSGSPIFDNRGMVVGIVDTLVFGVSASLDQLGKQYSTGSADMVMNGISLNGSFVNLIGNLETNLISGLGSGVAIDYAKEAQENASKK